jgi:hypothetical protein
MKLAPLIVLLPLLAMAADSLEPAREGWRYGENL